MPIEKTFIDSLTRCIRKVRSDLEGASGGFSFDVFTDRFDFSKFTSTLLSSNIDDPDDLAGALEALKFNKPLSDALLEKGNAFFKTLDFPDGLADLAGGLVGDVGNALKGFEVISHILLKYAISWKEYALKESSWDDIGYFGPRGERLVPPKEIIENNIAMTKAICYPEFIEANEKYLKKFYNVEYEEQMKAKYALLRDNIEDIDNYPDNYEPDIVIIGTGPGGGAAAHALSLNAHGKKILILERGDLHTSKEFNQKERDMVPALYQPPGFRLTDEYGVAILQGNLVGGSAMLNHGICYEVPEPVTDSWREADEGLPNIAQELERGGFYKKVNKQIHYEKIRRFSLNKNAQVLLRGLEKMKGKNGVGEVFEYHARNTNAKIEPNGMPGGRYHELTCTGCGFCPLGCRYDRKQTPLLTFIPGAIKNGLDGVGGNEIKAFKKAEVKRIVHEGGRVSSVVVKSCGADITIKASTVIVSCGAINSARLLMNSNVPNVHLGRHISLHPSPLIYGLFKDELIYSDWGVPMAASYTEYQLPEPGGPFPDGFGYILESIYSHPATAALTMPFETMKKRMAYYKNMASVAVILHDKPMGEIKNSNSLMSGVSYRMHEGDKEKLRHAVRTAAEIYLNAGATEVFTSHNKEIVFKSAADLDKAADCSFEPGEILLASAHPQGGCRMGSKGSGVVDDNGESHDIKGLFVSDASLYPTSLGVNPQLTTMAMGTKIGEYVANK